jgi:hypothetical protein
MDSSSWRKLDESGKSVSEAESRDREAMGVSVSLERRAGIEPANTGFADLRVDRFATGAHLKQMAVVSKDLPLFLEH